MRVTRRSILLALTGAILTKPELRAQTQFRAARFGGLMLGQATESQIVAKFGNPRTRYRAQDGTTFLYYDDIAPVRGRVEMLLDRKSRLINIEVSPTKSSLQEILQVYGPGYRIAHFDFDCGGDGENVPIYETKNGRYRHFLYESIGVSVSEDPLLIEYTAEPIGPKKSKCGKK